MHVEISDNQREQSVIWRTKKMMNLGPTFSLLIKDPVNVESNLQLINSYYSIIIRYIETIHNYAIYTTYIYIYPRGPAQ